MAAIIVYECPDCEERMIERRCQDCNLFTRRLGPAAPCPHCDEPVLITELLEEPNHPNAPTYTENLTGSDPLARSQQQASDRGEHDKSGTHAPRLHGAGPYRAGLCCCSKRTSEPEDSYTYGVAWISVIGPSQTPHRATRAFKSQYGNGTASPLQNQGAPPDLPTSNFLDSSRRPPAVRR